jgi:hypothetical protein
MQSVCRPRVLKCTHLGQIQNPWNLSSADWLFIDFQLLLSAYVWSPIFRVVKYLTQPRRLFFLIQCMQSSFWVALLKRQGKRRSYFIIRLSTLSILVNPHASEKCLHGEWSHITSNVNALTHTKMPLMWNSTTVAHLREGGESAITCISGV